MTTIKEFLDDLELEGIDCGDSTIDTPYCYVDNFTNANDSYAKFVNFVTSNTQVVKSRRDFLCVDFVGFIKDHIKAFEIFSNENCRSGFRRKDFYEEEDYIYEAGCPTLEQLLIGGYAEEDYFDLLNLLEL